MNDESKIALAALVVAVFSGLLNYFYTRRQFHISTTPAVRVELAGRIVQYCDPIKPEYYRISNSSLYPDVENVSTSIAISEVKITMELRQSHQKHRKIFHSDRISSIAPLERNRVLPRPLEGFLSIAYPNDVHLVEKAYTGKLQERTYNLLEEGTYINAGGHGVLPAYEMPIPHIIEIAIIVSYRPSIHNAGMVRIVKVYDFIPATDARNVLIAWEIKRIRKWRYRTRSLIRRVLFWR